MTNDTKYLTPESETVEAAMKSGDNVHVFRQEKQVFLRKFTVFIGFEPKGETNAPKGEGVILYPGAKVEPEKYSPIARSLAELGYHVAIVDFAFEFAFTNYKRADDVLSHISWKGVVKRWILSGHSLGGVMACAYAKDFADDKEKLKGVALLASFPSDSEKFFYGQLKGLGLKVSSIWGSKDGLTTGEKIEDSKSELPSDTHFFEIVGGNHTQFYYSDKLQDKDIEADISLNDQQIQIRKAMHELLMQVTE